MDVNVEAVEKLVQVLQASVPAMGEFQAGDGLSAVLTFAWRFISAVVTLSPTPEAKAKNVETIVTALRRMIGMLEFDPQVRTKETVH